MNSETYIANTDIKILGLINPKLSNINNFVSIKQEKDSNNFQERENKRRKSSNIPTLKEKNNLTYVQQVILEKNSEHHMQP